MFELEGEQYSLEQVTSAADQSNMPLEDYLKKYNIKELEETVETVEKPKDVVEKDATVTSIEPEQASESTELEQVDTSLVSEDPEPVVSASKQRILAREKRKQKKKDELKIKAEQYKIDAQGIPNTLNKAGSSIWSYTPANISNLYAKTSQQGLEGYSSTTQKQQALYDSYKNSLTGGFSYYDFINDEKINGISISELQQEDTKKAKSQAFDNRGPANSALVGDVGQPIRGAVNQS